MQCISEGAAENHMHRTNGVNGSDHKILKGQFTGHKGFDVNGI
jgi:hypothetical protein